jgi:23S rRNA (cytosine1962-C5)-methyltransferase
MVGAERDAHRQMISISDVTQLSSAETPVVVSRRGAERIRAGHPWIYRSDIVTSAAEPGDFVAVDAPDGRRQGWAFWSSASQIALRMVAGPSRTRPDEAGLIGERLRAAFAYRDRLAIDATACRRVSAEADGLPGVIVDEYADETGTYLVLQTLSQGADRRRSLLIDLLVMERRPRGILVRNDPKVRRLEGLEEEVVVAHGEVPDFVQIREGRVRLHVDLRHGQKTGTFLDQRENHAAATAYTGGRALDAFTYNGGFALQMASAAESVLALDSSEPAVLATRRNAAANGLTNIEVREANVFDELRELETTGAVFETVVLDPPAFARNRAAVRGAVAGYKEINLRAMKLLAPGGHLITCSCSYNVSEGLFLEVVEAAAADARATMSLVEKRLQSRDHPVLLAVPETYYLKCFVLRRVR